MTHASPPPLAPEPQHRGWILANLISLDMLVNTLFDGRVGDTISARCGRSMALGGWAARFPWPRWWVEHCYWAADLPLPHGDERS